MNDWSTRKMAIDVIYTLAAILKDVLTPFKEEILEVLNHLRFDKFKQVREATTEAVQIIQSLGGEEVVEERYEEPVRQEKKFKSSLKKPTVKTRKSK